MLWKSLRMALIFAFVGEMAGSVSASPRQAERSAGADQTVAVEATLASGAPAAGAAVVITASLKEAPGWGALCDAAGKLAVPVDAGGGWIAVRHPEAGFLLQPWGPPAAGETVHLTLPETGPVLLTRVVRERDEPVAHAEIILWLGETKLEGTMLAWLTSTRGASDKDGYWRALGVPPQDVVLLALPAGGRPPGGTAGDLEAQGTRVSFPWPDEVRLTPVGR
jgi:hypothetical protein